MKNQIGFWEHMGLEYLSIRAVGHHDLCLIAVIIQHVYPTAMYVLRLIQNKVDKPRKAGTIDGSDATFRESERDQRYSGSCAGISEVRIYVNIRNEVFSLAFDRLLRLDRPSLRS